MSEIIDGMGYSCLHCCWLILQPAVEMIFSCCFWWSLMLFCTSPICGKLWCPSLFCSRRLFSQSEFDLVHIVSSTSSYMLLGFWRTARKHVCVGCTPLRRLCVGKYLRKWTQTQYCNSRTILCFSPSSKWGNILWKKGVQSLQLKSRQLLN